MDSQQENLVTVALAPERIAYRQVFYKTGDRPLVKCPRCDGETAEMKRNVCLSCDSKDWY